MSGKFWISALVVTVVYFLFGGLVYGFLLRDWFAAQGYETPAEPNMAFIFLATLAYGVLMAYTYPVGYRGGPAGSEGIRFGILFALIINLPSSLFLMAMTGFTVAGLIVSLILEITIGAVLGFIVAKIYGGTVRAVEPRPV